ncbi:hypothetical protein Fifi44_00026 [Erwinia phage Fifi44]|uniref:Uncharacterized protein n=1 Tax=Erwinia phage Fifi44 TaxID=2876597 RepID=A0AAE9C0F7_9CAUD|nr:hypothetical protein QNG95_gp26 [Erwinia phage Fifi44]UCR74895.1 hypothetical protein Fifi44_00026 [Erwinia phage Fifi44]UCR80871.1 hypothetical protein Fifi451_00051 [Erwinia phage Fifi451]
MSNVKGFITNADLTMHVESQRYISEWMTGAPLEMMLAATSRRLVITLEANIQEIKNVSSNPMNEILEDLRQRLSEHLGGKPVPNNATKELLQKIENMAKDIERVSKERDDLQAVVDAAAESQRLAMFHSSRAKEHRANLKERKGR